MAKLAGVVKMAAVVVTADIDTESSRLPFEMEVMKFDTLPPGQEPTKIMPIATIGVMCLWKMMMRRKVMAGMMIHWPMTPTRIDFGLRNTSAKVPGLMPSATPYITIARAIFSISIPDLLKLILTGSRFSSCSYMVWRPTDPGTHPNPSLYGGASQTSQSPLPIKGEMSIGQMGG